MVPTAPLVRPFCVPLHIASPARASADRPSPACRCASRRLKGRRLPVADGVAWKGIGRPASTWTPRINPTHRFIIHSEPGFKISCRILQAVDGRDIHVLGRSMCEQTIFNRVMTAVSVVSIQALPMLRRQISGKG